MTNEELNMKLYDKLTDEQKTFKKWLLTQPPEEILNHAYVTRKHNISTKWPEHECGEFEALYPNRNCYDGAATE